MFALVRLFAVVVGLMVGARVYAAEAGTLLSLVAGALTALLANWLLSLGGRRIPQELPEVIEELERPLPMRKDVRRRGRGRRVLLRDADDPPQT
jgi:hypothetical protein